MMLSSSQKARKVRWWECLRLSRTQIIAFGFVVLILFGAILLTLPISSRNGESIGFINALFTATTSTCVTGLIIADTYSQWTIFGQVIILILIQTGGLGFMTVATLFSLAINRRIGINERLIMSESINLDNMAGIVKMMKKIIVLTICFELIGAILLSTSLVPEFGVMGGIYKSIFHSISAFCNAGIDLMGEKIPYSSLETYNSDFIVNGTIIGLIIAGGLGFAVWDDLLQFRKSKKLRLHTKIVLVVTSILLIGGATLIYLMETGNPQTMKGMNIAEKLMASLFQATSPRTAGFNSLPMTGLTDGTIFIIMILVFIGGSPGSTAGGIKTTTMGLLVLTARSVIRGDSRVHVFGRRISSAQVFRAMAIVGMSIGAVCIGTLLLLNFDDLTLKQASFEVVSAFGTAGLSLGVTSGLSSASKLVLILMMYFGRVGILTTAFAIARKQHIHEDRMSYPKESIML